MYVIPPVAASVFFIFLYSLFSTIEYYYQKTGFIAVATCICAVLNLVLNYICIKIYGYYAAGYTTLICYIGLALLHYIFYKQVLKEEQICNDLYDIKWIILLSVMVIAIMILMAMTYEQLWIRYSLVLIGTGIVLTRRKEIIKILLILRERK